jgi:hypothetical protein
MFENQPHTFAMGLRSPSYVNHANLLNSSISLFNRSRWNAALAKLIAILLRGSQALFDLEIIPDNLGRSTDFDKQFHPLSDRIQDRWVSIAMARGQNLPLAPVELIQIGDRYFVKDGHHRISVACARGETVIDAEIIIWDVSCNLPWDVQPAVHALPQTA